MDLKEQVIEALKARKGQWKALARELEPRVSYSLISQLGRGTYASDPSYSTLKLLGEHLGVK